jgi:hypothetical protein
MRNAEFEFVSIAAGSRCHIFIIKLWERLSAAINQSFRVVSVITKPAMKGAGDA